MPGYDWDALAPHWHLFEDRGFADALVSALVRDRIQAPILVVGAGLGRYAAMLRDRVGPTLAVDGSWQMAARAVAAHPLPFVVADARHLPFPDDTFAGVVCASGVVEGMTGDDRAALVHELDRVARAGFYLAAFVTRDGVPPAHVHAILDRWSAGAIAHPEFDAVAAALGDRSTAAALLRGALPEIEPAITERVLIDAAAQHELSVRRVDRDDLRGAMLWFVR